MEILLLASLLCLAEPTAPVAPASQPSSPPSSSTSPSSSPSPPPSTSSSPAPAAAPAPVKQKPKLLVLDVKSGDLTADQTSALTSVVATRAARFSQVEVVSSVDLRELVELEAEKQQAGCDEGSSCLAEIAGALGADYVLSSRAGKLGNTYVVALQLYDADKGSAATRDTAEAYSVDELPSKLTPMVDAALTQVLGPPQLQAGAVAEAAPAEEGRDALHLALLGGGAGALGVGLVVAVLGAVPRVMYEQKKGELNQRTRAYGGDPKQLDAATAAHADAVRLRDLYNGAGRAALVGGGVLVVVGAAALATGLLLPPLDELGAPGKAP